LRGEPDNSMSLIDEVVMSSPIRGLDRDEKSTSFPFYLGNLRRKKWAAPKKPNLTI
jgi:hypothetical protein